MIPKDFPISCDVALRIVIGVFSIIAIIWMIISYNKKK